MLNSQMHVPEPPRFVRLSRLLHLPPALPLVLLQLQLHVLGVSDLEREGPNFLRLTRLSNEELKEKVQKFDSKVA